MKEAIIETTTYNFSPEWNEEQSWISKWEVIKFAWFMKLYIEWTDEENGDEEGPINLPPLAKWETAISKSLSSNQNFSKPPSRYTEAMLVKKLESEWIGRPSTYAPTIQTIVDRWYVEKIAKKLAPKDPEDLKWIPYVVNDFLEKYFPELMNYKFTAKIEEEFDEIAEWKLDWIKFLNDFYGDFKVYLEKTMTDAEKIVEETGKECPECGWKLVYKYSKTGKFIWCGNFPKCKYIENSATPAQNDRMNELREKYEWQPCEAWGTIVVKVWRFWPFLASSLYPEVKWIGKIPDEKTTMLEEKFWGWACDQCENWIMHVKNSRRWPFLACSNYPNCKNAKNLPKIDDVIDEAPSEEKKTEL